MPVCLTSKYNNWRACIPDCKVLHHPACLNRARQKICHPANRHLQFRFVRRNKTNLFAFHTHKTSFLSKHLKIKSTHFYLSLIGFLHCVFVCVCFLLQIRRWQENTVLLLLAGSAWYYWFLLTCLLTSFICRNLGSFTYFCLPSFVSLATSP